MSNDWKPKTLGLRVYPAFGTERMIMLEELGGTYYVVCYKPRQQAPPDSTRRKRNYESLSESVGQSSEFCRDGYAVVWEERLEPAEVQRILDLLRQTRNPVPCETTYGLDGETYELFWEDETRQKAYRWWMYPPKEWTGLGAVANALRAHVLVWGFD